MFTQKPSVVAIICLLVILLCLAACGKKLSDEELAFLDKAVEEKLQAVAQKFESVGLKEAADFCQSNDRVVTSAGTFVVNSTISAEFYDPKSKTVTKGNEIIFPVSIYARVDNADDVEYYLKKGCKFRSLTISAFARNEEAYFEPIITKRKHFD